MEKELPQPLLSVLGYGFHVEMRGAGWSTTIRENLQLFPDGAKTFRRQFAHAILNRTISLEQYVAITKDSDITSEDELYEFLRERWSRLYGPVPITEDE
jgi:hypothetical protein